MPHHFNHDIDPALQQRIETTIPAIGRVLGREPAEWTAKSPNDEELAEDLAADRVWRSVAQELGLHYLSEELTEAEWEQWSQRVNDPANTEWTILIADPIDGSSEWHRTGWRHSPVLTAAMVLTVTRSNGTLSAVLRAAAAGALWQGITYGIYEDRLTVAAWDAPQSRRPISVSNEKQCVRIAEAMIAAYAPKDTHADVVQPLFKAAPYVHNNGGMAFSLRVVEGISARSYAASVEPVPCAIWEHAGPVLASFGGAAVARLDGRPLVLNPFERQTSVVASNSALLDEIVRVCNSRADNCRVSHMEPLLQIKTEYQPT